MVEAKGVSEGGAVAVAVAFGRGVLVAVTVVIGISVWISVGRFESSALAGLTLYCKIGQKIRNPINNIIEEQVSTIPRENLPRICGRSSSRIDLQS